MFGQWAGSVFTLISLLYDDLIILMEILFCPVVDEAIGSRDYVPIPFMAVSQSLQGQPIASGTSLLRIPLVPHRTCNSGSVASARVFSGSIWQGLLTFAKYVRQWLECEDTKMTALHMLLSCELMIWTRQDTVFDYWLFNKTFGLYTHAVLLSTQMFTRPWNTKTHLDVPTT